MLGVPTRLTEQLTFRAGLSGQEQTEGIPVGAGGARGGRGWGPSLTPEAHRSGREKTAPGLCPLGVFREGGLKVTGGLRGVTSRTPPTALRCGPRAGPVLGTLRRPGGEPWGPDPHPARDTRSAVRLPAGGYTADELGGLF